MTDVFMAVAGSLLVAGRNGAWNVEERLAGSGAECVTLDPTRLGRVYCGGTDGAFRSDDRGATWVPLGLSQVTAVAVDRAGTVFAGTEPSRLYRSDDAGASWRECEAMAALPSAPTWSFPPKPWTSHVRWITPDPVVDGRLFVCIEAGALLRSLDGGETWEDRRPDGPIDTHTLLAHPAAPGRLYSAAGDGLMAPGRGFSLSGDAAESWQHPDDGLEHHYLWGAAVDPDDPDSIVVSAARSPQQAHAGSEAHPGRDAQAFVYRSAGGGPWTRVSDGLPEPDGTNSWVLAAPAPGTVYAASNRGLYRSEDGGDSWRDEALPPFRGRVDGLAVAV
jgi:photosystem II stability/assembly factor-like uncharacterized protein